MLKPYTIRKQKFKRVSTTAFLLQSKWKGDIDTLEPYTGRNEAMKRFTVKIMARLQNNC